MNRIDLRDVIGGGLLVAFGLALGIYATGSYQLGHLNQMGPGMFPAVMGWIVAGLGMMLLVSALFRTGPALPRIKWRPLIWVLMATAVFALLIRPLGMLPSVAAAALVAVLADGRLSVPRALALAAVLVVAAWLTFRVGLGTAVPLYRWPF